MNGIDEMFHDYKLTYVIQYINKATDKYSLREAVQGLELEDLFEREDVIETFKDKAKELGIDDDKLYDWITY